MTDSRSLPMLLMCRCCYSPGKCHILSRFRLDAIHASSAQLLLKESVEDVFQAEGSCSAYDSFSRFHALDTVCFVCVFTCNT